MRALLRRIDGFFFSPVAATGFGLMRIFWALTALVTLLLQAPDVARYYSGNGIFTLAIDPNYQRTIYRFSVLLWITDPQAVVLVYCAMIAVFVAMLVGFWPRVSTIVSVLLLFSFHERNPYVFAGGDTVLRTAGFILMIAPVGVHALSFSRLRRQWTHWKKTRALLPPLTMPAWPMRLVLWQLLVIYLTSLWGKLLGTMWMDGTTVAIALHHEHFIRFPGPVTDALSLLSPMLGWSWMIYEATWAAMLVPKTLFRTLRIEKKFLRRGLIVFGVVYHLFMEILLRVGSFFGAMCTLFAGLLQREDFECVKRWMNRRFRAPISVLYDGHCGLCQRSMFGLSVLDWLKRLRPVNFQDAAERKKFAPDIPVAKLDRAMHIRLSNRETLQGFDAFRRLCWHLPPLWLLAPLLFIPGVPTIGRAVYAEIAERRKKCTHEGCTL